MTEKQTLVVPGLLVQNISVVSYPGLKELQYVDLLLDLQRIATCKDSKNYSM